MKLINVFGISILISACTGIAAAQTWTTYTSETSGLAANVVKAIGVDDRNVKWFGTSDGLSQFDGDTWITYTTGDNLAHNAVNALAFEVTSSITSQARKFADSSRRIFKPDAFP